jgi:hypothetical protein
MDIAELEEYKKAVDPSDLLKSKKPVVDSAFLSAGETKQVHIHRRIQAHNPPTSP